ncbi:MAG: SPOR domain-containing protein, partial [Methylococcales bacterium]|nr:SPOR domain-containing protein [Methylococcales bacterium]
ILGSYKNISRAQRSMDTYNKKGFTTSINKIRSGGRSWHQISTTLFRTKNEAKQHLRQMKRKVKIESSMIIRR